MHKILLLSLTVTAFAVDSTVLKCGKVLDAKTGTYLSNASVVVTDGFFESIDGPTSTSAATVDLSSRVCLPGLIDVHTHITSDPRASGYRRLGISVPGARQASRSRKVRNGPDQDLHHRWRSVQGRWRRHSAVHASRDQGDRLGGPQAGA